MEHASRRIVAYPTLPGLACLPTPRLLTPRLNSNNALPKTGELGVLSLDQASQLVNVPSRIRNLRRLSQGAFTFILDAVSRLTRDLVGDVLLGFSLTPRTHS